MWIRGWFPDGPKSAPARLHAGQSRPGRGHGGYRLRACTTAWPPGGRRKRNPATLLEVTVLGSNFSLPDPAPAGYVIVGDSASLPAINSLLDAIGDAPALVFLESAHDDDQRAAGRACRGRDVGGPQERRRGAGAGGQARRRSTHPNTSAGSHATTGLPARSSKIFREDYKHPAQVDQGAGVLGGMTDGGFVARVKRTTVVDAPQ